MKYYFICIVCTCNILSCFCQQIKTVKIKDISTKLYSSFLIEENWNRETIYLINKSTQKLDTVKISNAVEIDTIKINIDRFIEIVYRTRGGSGEHMHFTKIFCVNNGVLKESLSLLSFYKSYSTRGNLEESNTVNVVVGRKNDTYYAELFEEKRGKTNMLKKKFHLQFADDYQIFFSKICNDSRANICNMLKENIKYYTIALMGESYLYYKNKWFQLGNKCYIAM